ncbi:PAS domain-containing protein [Bradyrhizobium sp. SRL28]|uniref:sensor histidine kinase n=1 Tax=Bradyrhizobium sp. SRL28 TaxID=2836178 RepID=UPI001BDED9C4|nr:ATP-binding protein [Bradyrhizobium sp. SRL28]MBT1514451.1 PAS domain-containing protein [Bradyrhizobium sp. SRL28]
MLEGLTATQPAGVRTLEAFKSRLKERGVQNIEIFIEFLELGRFPGQAHETRTAHYLKEKYSENPPDLVIPISRGALAFSLQYRSTVAADTPIVYCCTAASSVTAMNVPRNVPGVVTEYNWLQTLALAERLQPEARNLVVISGASDFDRAWQEDARHQIEGRSKRFNTNYMAGLPYEDLLREVSQLPRDTIVLLVPVFVDGSGRPRMPPEVAADVARVSSAPGYAPAATFFGHGIVGGYMDSFEAHGTAAADLALEILSGRDPTTLPAQTKPTHTYQIDARQLARWQLSEGNLPPGSVVLLAEPTLWERHRTLVIAVIVGFALQSAVVTFLLIQMRKRRQAELSLKESEDRLAFAAAAANIGIWRLDVATNEFWSTEYCRSILGLADQKPLNLDRVLSAVHPEDRHSLAETLTSAADDGLVIDNEFRVAAPGQEVRWLLARGHSLFNNGGDPVGISGIFADISARKAAEAEADLQRKEVSHLMRVSVLGQLSGAIAHELNQPLTAILAYAQAARKMIARNNSDLGKITEVLDDIVAEDKRASEVIRRLHGLLRKGESKTESINLNDLVDSTLRLLRSELIDRRIKVDVTLEHNLPRTSGDPVQLQQVLLNLLMNGMDAMNAASLSQRVLTVGTRSSGTGTIEAFISDRGQGIAPEEHSRIFQPFFTTKHQGLGLGLAICSTIVKTHGGKLGIDNNADGGATASFALPVVVEMAPAS